ncbi:MAG TPA: AraC family transcriptional regulator [Bryobacteraceae bacterium]|nr:AraC family transcriptional regulator [Bryobacteraceae bacterium]
MAKIAAATETSPGREVLARGAGWEVSDVRCTLGPRDRPFEEQHSGVSIAAVVAGTFQYRSSIGRELMTPGALLLGNAGQCYECGHEHGAGDRCVAFSYAPEFFDRLAFDAGAPRARFKVLRLPPLRALSPVLARVSSALARGSNAAWEELSVQLAARAVQVERGLSLQAASAEPGAVARVTRVVRMLERDPDSSPALRSLAREARLSLYHFLRVFQAVTGATPHQYVLRMRLRRAATRLVNEPEKILDVALDSGFGDVSNFNRAFRAEFGVSPRQYRRSS